MKYTGGILGVIAALVLSAGAASGQTTPVRVSLADTVRTALPGSLISYVFTIELPDGEGGNAELSLPAHWRALTGGGELPRGSRRISYLVATSVPPSAAPGRYRIELAIRRLADTYRAAGWIIVPARHSLTLSAMESPDMVIGGSPIHGRFLLTNRGNARASVRVRIRSAQLSSVDSMHLELAAGASREIPVDLRTDPRIGTLIQSVTTAYAEEIGLPAEVARASFRVSIAPRETYAAAPTHSIGSRLRMIGTSTPGKGSG